MFEHENQPNLIYVEVVDGIVVNRLLGNDADPLTAENLFIQPYPVKIGWKKINENLYLPPEMTEEEFNTLVNQYKPKINNAKEYYDNLVNSTNYQNNISNELKERVTDFITKINLVHEKINQHDGWILLYVEHKTYYSEPFSVRPNIENEA